ncbi:MAG: cytochrome P450 [Gammaproteobacteria bacterium]|nr:cytochrome P450 [Gammaproteobacteria bacterium]
MESLPPRSRSELPPPPGPRGLPIIGSLHKLPPNANHIDFVRFARPYGDICRFRIGSVRTVMLAHPDLIVEAFGKPEINERHRLEVFTCLSEHEGLIYSSYGDHWRNVSQVAREKLWSAGDVAAICQPHFEYTADEMRARMVRAAEEGMLVDDPVKVLFSSNYSLALRTLFGLETDYDDEFRRNKEALERHIAWFDAAASSTGNLADVFHWLKVIPSKMLRESRRQRASRDRILTALVDSVARHRAGNRSDGPRCMVDVLLALEDAGEIGRGAINALCMDVLGAVPAGLAATVSWFLLLMANRPEAQARVHEEIDRVVGRDRPAGADDRKNLPYTFACVAESMRFRTIAPFGIPHRTTQETEVGGYRIPANMQVFGSIYSVHHDPRFWESPDEFLPERFLPETEGSLPAALGSPAYMPFGRGNRVCTGDHYAMAAFWTYAVRLMQHLRFETPGGEPLSEEEKWGLSVSPVPHDLKVVRRHGSGPGGGLRG